MRSREGTKWQEKLCQYPEKAGKCPWDKLNGENWVNLLRKQPQFADKCQWQKLNGENWTDLLCVQPQFENRYRNFYSEEISESGMGIPEK